ncbi:MAG: hypothetical protein GY867_03540, partial [bacterium]|nr:hypothetical protein [bacterium]
MHRYRFLSCLLLALWAIAPPASAARSENPESEYLSVLAQGDFDPQGMTVDSVEIDNRDIYDTSDPAYSSFLFRLANSLHVVTKERIIRRELLLREGDLFVREIADEMARNLRARFPFNDAWIELELFDGGRLLLRVVTIDQWSLIGGLKSIDTDGGETDYQMGFEERNFLGRAQFWSFDYYVREADENYVTTELYEPRIFGRSFDIRWRYSSNPFDFYRQLAVGRPFYNLAQRWSYGLSVLHGGSREERFLSNQQVSEWEDRSDRIELSATYRRGPFYRKTSISGHYTYLYRKLTDRTILDSAAFSIVEFPDDSVYHQFNLSALHSRQRFIVEQRINGFEYHEDITLGESVGLTFGRAFRPRLSGHHYNFINLLAQASHKIAGNIILAKYSRSFWYKSGTDTRRLTELTLRAYNNQLSFITFALRSQYVSDKTDNPNGLVLGGKSGLRGYDKEYTSGDRVHIVNVEGRFYPGVELLSIKIGAAAFTDFGRAWRTGEAVEIK